MKPTYLVTLAIWPLAACSPSLDGDRDYCAEMFAPVGLDLESHPQAHRLQELLDDAVAGGLPGVSAMVQAPAGTWIGSSGQCDADQDLPFGLFTRSRVGSVTKTFAAAATLLLVEEGVLGLEDPIADHLDSDVAARVVNSDRITIRQLLNHTSGLPNEPMTVSAPTALEWFADDPYQEVTPDEYIEWLYGRPALFEPGEGWAYSNFGYALLGEIMEEATGDNQFEVVQSRVIEPLGLHDTFFHPDDRTPEGLARGYADLYGTGTLTDTSDWDALHVINTEGGVVSTVYDLGRFLDAVLYGDLLADSSLREMTTCVEAAPDDGLEAYAMGLACTTIDGKPTYNHLGEVIGYLAGIYAYPEQDAIVTFMVNGSFGPLEQELAELLFTDIPPLLE